MKNKTSFVRGEALLLLLATCSSPIRFLKDKERGIEELVSPSVAVGLARSGVFEGKVQKDRIKYIRSCDPRSSTPFDAEFRRGQCVLRWWGDETASVNPKLYRKRIAIAWDRIAKADPPPRRFL